MMPIHFASDGRFETLREPIITPASAVFEIMLTDRLAQNNSGTDYFMALRSAPLAHQAYRANSPDEPQHQPALHVGQIMKTDVHCLGPDSLVSQAARDMKAKHFRHIPICDAHGILLGIISDRDLNLGTGEDMRVTDLIAKMGTTVLSATADTSIREASRVMLTAELSALPVVDATGRVIGIISVSDILHSIVDHAPIELWV